MKTNLFCVFLLLNTINFCRAQDSSVVLDTSMFDKYFQTIPLTQLKGWIFKQGNDTNCSKTEIDAVPAISPLIADQDRELSRHTGSEDHRRQPHTQLQRARRKADAGLDRTSRCI